LPQNPPAAPSPTRLDPNAFNRLALELRPKLHRYCARMTGSAIDGEDVVQQALLKALEALPQTGPLADPQAWLFRIAHNAAQDFLRRRRRESGTFADEDVEMIANADENVDLRQVATASLRSFMRLPPAQRSAVILRDVLGHSMLELSQVLGTSLPAVKAALQRGRARLQELAGETDDIAPPALADAEHARLLDYVERFNDRDFDAIRAMLAEDVKLDLVTHLAAKGRAQVGSYFYRYSLVRDWHCVPGIVDGRAAVVMYDPEDKAGPPGYFILLEWLDGSVTTIRDFRFARYALEGAEIMRLG
jgi:RNA polymerase sigma-70 factor (ECF subfamily)